MISATPRAAFPAFVDRAAFPFAVYDLEIDGAQHAYVDTGGEAGDRVFVLSHGTPTWSIDWRHLIPVLAQRGRVIALDHLGFGLSARPRDADYRPEAHAARFARFVDAVVPADARVDLLCHDFGGPFALPWAKTMQHRLRSLTLLNTFSWAPVDDDDLGPKARLAATGLVRLLYRHLNASQQIIARSAFGSRRAWLEARDAMLGPFASDADGRERVLYALARSMTSSTTFFRGLERDASSFRDVPTLVAWGMRDSAFTPATLSRLASLYPHAQVYRCEGSGHWPRCEAAIEVSRAIDAFVATAR
jgi:haloalkane dehalogenase